VADVRVLAASLGACGGEHCRAPRRPPRAIPTHGHMFVCLLYLDGGALPWRPETEEAMMAEHKDQAEHTLEDHTHGEGCGHETVQHDDHVDYLHDGHKHAEHGDHYDEH
jgi:hypothetical protein